MKVFIRVKAGAKKEKIERTGEGDFTVFVKEPPVDGRANAAIIKVLAGYFGVRRGGVKIISGHSGRRKIIEIVK